MATLRSRRRAGTTDARRTSPSPFTPSRTPRPAQFGAGVHHNVAVPMSDGVVLRADIHYPTVPETGRPAAGPFPVLLSMTPYGKKAPQPAAQIGAGATGGGEKERRAIVTATESRREGGVLTEARGEARGGD